MFNELVICNSFEMLKVEMRDRRTEKNKNLIIKRHAKQLQRRKK